MTSVNFKKSNLLIYISESVQILLSKITVIYLKIIIFLSHYNGKTMTKKYY